MPAALYVVEPGDGWYLIARKLGVTASALLTANGMSIDTPLNVGRVLTYVQPVPPPPPPPPPPPADVLWWKGATLRSDHPDSDRLALSTVADPFSGDRDVVKVDCLPGTTLDQGGVCYGFTDRVSFARLGLCTSDAVGVPEFTWEGEFVVPADWGDTESDARWVQTRGYKMSPTFCSYDPTPGRGIMSQPYSNNFAALAWACSLGTIAKGPTSGFNRDQMRPATFFSCARAGGWTRTPQPNGTLVSMMSRYWHLNPDPLNPDAGVGSTSKPFVYISRGRWHTIKVYARANSAAGVADGEYRAWFNGELAMHYTDLMLGATWVRGFNGWHNQYFHGGPEGCDTPQTMYLGPASFTVPA
jgi:hypothetical protein